MRYIIECNDPNDIILGMKSIKSLIEDGDKDAVVRFTNGSLWYVKRTKKGTKIYCDLLADSRKMVLYYYTVC